MSGVYNFDSCDKVYVFSDIEGRIPIEAGDKGNEDVKRVIEIIKSPESLKKTEAIIFTGDLIDRGPDNIKLMTNMIRLKNINKDSVCLIGGNRDLNKVRMIDEFFVIEKNTKQPPWMSFTMNTFLDFLKLCEKIEREWNINYIFLFEEDSLKKPLIKTQESGWKSIEEEKRADGITYAKIFSESLTERVANIYTHTLGAKAYVETFAKEEYQNIFNIPVSFNSYHALIALMNMIMGVIWDIELIPGFLRPYNGLYIEYIKRCHLITAFRKNKHYGVVSHSGIPFVENEFIITDPLGSKKTNNSVRKATVQIIKNLNETMIAQLTFFNFSRTTLSNLSLFRNSISGLITFIRMCAHVGTPTDNEKINSSMSPVVSMPNITEKGPLARKNDKFTFTLGGSSYSTGEEVGDGSFRYYNIYGHQPAGFVPRSSMLQFGTNKMFHVCLDISKAESFANANIGSMALLVITEERQYITEVLKFVGGNDPSELKLYTDTNTFLQFNTYLSNYNNQDGINLSNRDGIVVAKAIIDLNNSFYKAIITIDQQYPPIVGGKKKVIRKPKSKLV